MDRGVQPTPGRSSIWTTRGTSCLRLLALWRGPALADFAYDDFARTEIARLEERRRAVLEQRIEADLALGRHTALVGELAALE
jgi:DNA-binding SARP family transcriptional activator